MPKLKLQYFGHLMPTADSLEKSLMLGKIEGRRKRGRQRMRWLDDTTGAMDVNLGKLEEMVRGREAWRAAVPGAAARLTGPGDSAAIAATREAEAWTHAGAGRLPSVCFWSECASLCLEWW